MDDREEYLTQLRTSGTSAEILYSPAKGVQVFLTRIWIANNDTQTREYSLYFDNDGTTYDGTTAIAPLVSLAAGKGEYVDLLIPMRNSDGNFAVKSSVANMYNFTLFGIIL